VALLVIIRPFHRPWIALSGAPSHNSYDPTSRPTGFQGIMLEFALIPNNFLLARFLSINEV
jgi:hypothetical protein